MKHKLESRLPGEISITSYADDITLMAESEEKLNSLLMKVKEQSEKVSLKINIQKSRYMTFGRINSWQIDRETMDLLEFQKGVHKDCTLSPCLFNLYAEYNICWAG